MNDLTVGYPHALNTFVYYGKGYKSPLSFTTKKGVIQNTLSFTRKKGNKKSFKVL